MSDTLVLVPREPTDAMLRAGKDAFMAAHDPFYIKNDPAEAIWRCMIGSAPHAADASAHTALLKECLEVVGGLEEWIDASEHSERCFTNDPNPDACRCVCQKDDAAERARALAAKIRSAINE